MLCKVRRVGLAQPRTRACSKLSFSQLAFHRHKFVASGQLNIDARRAGLSQRLYLSLEFSTPAAALFEESLPSALGRQSCKHVKSVKSRERCEETLGNSLRTAQAAKVTVALRPWNGLADDFSLVLIVGDEDIQIGPLRSQHRGA